MLKKGILHSKTFNSNTMKTLNSIYKLYTIVSKTQTRQFAGTYPSVITHTMMSKELDKK